MDFDAFIQSFFHCCLVTFFNFLVFVAVLDNSMVVRMRKLVNHYATWTPQVNVLDVTGAIIYFHTFCFISAQTIFNQPFLIGVVATASSLNRACLWAIFDG